MRVFLILFGLHIANAQACVVADHLDDCTDAQVMQHTLKKLLALMEETDSDSLEYTGMTKLLMHLNRNFNLQNAEVTALLDASKNGDDTGFRERATSLALSKMNLKEITSEEHTWLSEYARAIVELNIVDAAGAQSRNAAASTWALANIMSESLRKDRGKTYQRVLRSFKRLALKTGNSAFYQKVDESFGLTNGLRAAVKMACGVNVVYCKLVEQPLKDAAVKFGIRNLNILGARLAWGSLTVQLTPVLYKLANKEISAADAAVSVTTTFVEAAAGLAGGAVGAKLGEDVGKVLGWPVTGAMIGGWLGSWIGGQAGRAAIDVFFKRLFNLSSNQRVNEAYAYFNATSATPTKEINHAYRTLAKMHHPDKGGSQEEFIKLNTYLEVIRRDRDEQLENISEEDDEDDEIEHDEL